ncbi:MAG TPA: hypothetical protein V6C86_17650 [Oculatellaceae cyanobacterium]
MSKPNTPHESHDNAERSATLASDKEAVKAPIVNADENALQIKQRERENMRVLRFTKDDGNAFKIKMDDGSEVADQRKLSTAEAVSIAFSAAAVPIDVVASENKVQAAPKIPDAVQSYLKRLSGQDSTHKVVEALNATSGNSHHLLIAQSPRDSGHERTSMHAGEPPLTAHEQVLQKEHELEKKYGVHFTQAGDELGRQRNVDGTYGLMIHSREPSLKELEAIEKALANGGPELQTKDGHRVTFAFPDMQRHGGADATTDFQAKLNSGATVEIFPKGANEANVNPDWIVHALRHELSHNTLSKVEGSDEDLPDSIGQKVGYKDVILSPENHIYRSKDGRLWMHRAGTDDDYFWTEVDNLGHDKPDTSNNLTKMKKENIKLQHLSAIEVVGPDGRIQYFTHTIGDTGANYWTRRNSDGDAVDSNGHLPKDPSKIEHRTNEQMKKEARISPISDYFDSGEEAVAEAITNFRSGEKERHNLLKASRDYYDMAKAQDQNEIDSYYGKQDGKSVMIRLPNGEIVKNTAEAREKVKTFENS